MALVLNDRVKETTTTTGTGTVNLAGAETGFETFVAGIGNSNTTYYAIVHQSAAEFEVGLGTVTDASPDTLARTTVISSSNSDSAVNFSAGTKDVFCTLPASKAVFIDGSGDLEFNAPGDDFSFKNSSNTIAFIKTTNDDFIIQNNLNDKDFILKGYDSDGGGLMTGLTIDYSNAGKATFGGDIKATKIGAGISPIVPCEVLSTGATSTALRVLKSGSDDSTQNNLFSVTEISGHGRLSIHDTSQNEDIRFDSNGDSYFNGGNVGIGTTSPSEKLTVNGNIANTSGDMSIDVVGDIILDADGENIIFKDGGTERGQIDLGSANFTLRASTSDKDMIFRVNDGGSEIVALTIDASEAGAATFNNNVTAFSDERLKDNIETIENGLDKVEQLRGVTYTRDERENIGVIAQEVEKILPEIVLTADDEMGTKSVDYSRLTAVLIEAVKDLSARVKELEGK